jgi:molybdate transport system ATP-binding protein
MTLDLNVSVRRAAFHLAAAVRVEAGETVALLGPNGAGKSTLVDVVAGLVEPDDGAVTLDGVALDDPRRGVHVPPESRPVGVVFQDLLLLPHLTAAENVAFPLRARGWRRAPAVARAGSLLRDLEVGDRAARRPGELSGGEAQRVALARALAGDPRVLLLDEPTSGLDVAAAPRIRALLAETLRRFHGMALIVTHEPVEALTLAHRLVVVEGGRVAQTGTPEEIRTAPRTRYVADVVGVNVLPGALEPVADGAGVIRTPAADIVVAWPPSFPREPISDVVGVVRPSDVGVHIARPSGSPRNVLHGRVESISIEGERARIVADTDPPLAAEITLGSLRRLEIAAGSAIWLSFKAVEVSVVAP